LKPQRIVSWSIVSCWNWSRASPTHKQRKIDLAVAYWNRNNERQIWENWFRVSAS
jgi:hypothetical protein